MAEVVLRPLVAFDPHLFRRIATGYVSPERYAVRRTESRELTVICLELTPLDQPYVKVWDPPTRS